MFNKLTDLNINLTKEKKELFEKYIEAFYNYNAITNLISKNDEKVLFEKHIFDSLAINLFLEKHNLKQNINLLDIGTGGGFPSLPISLAFDNIHTTALDSIKKKIKFIEKTKEELNLGNIDPVCARAEELNSEKRNSFDVVTSRAMAELRIILEYAIPYVKVGGYFVAYKSLKANEEIENAKNALKELNSKVVDIIEYDLPLEENTKRVLIVIKKEKVTKSIYPRQNGLISKKPL